MTPISTKTYTFDTDLGCALFILIASTIDEERGNDYRYRYNQVITGKKKMVRKVVMNDYGM